MECERGKRENVRCQTIGWSAKCDAGLLTHHASWPDCLVLKCIIAVDSITSGAISSYILQLAVVFQAISCIKLAGFYSKAHK